MSILNRASDGAPAPLLALWRTVRTLEPITKDKLLGICAPESIGDNQARAGKTLLRWIQFGLFVEARDKLKLSPVFSKIDESVVSEFRVFRREVRRLALSERNNRDFLKPKPSGTADFTFAVTWLLSTDVFGDHLKSLETVQGFEEQQIKPLGAGNDKYALQNSTRWDGFRDWAAFLGFGSNASPFQLDPTEAVEDELGEVFANGDTLTTELFVQRLGMRLPVLDGGEYFRRARDRAKPAWRPIRDHELSPALTRALLRLELAKRVELHVHADADSRQLLGPGFKDVRKVSHLQLLPVSA